MGLVVNEEEIDLVFFNGTALKGLYFNGTEVDYLPISKMMFNGGITDYGSADLSWTATGSTAISTAQKHEGTHSLKCDSGVLYATLPMAATYTVEFWLYIDSANLEADTWGAAFTFTNTDGIFIVGDGTLQAYSENSLVHADYDNYSAVDKWAHYSISYDGTNTTLKLNGVSKAFYSGKMGENSSNIITIGGYTSDGVSFSSAHKPYIDGFKITSP